MTTRLVLFLQLLFFIGVWSQSCNIYTTRVDCGFVGITQQQCQQKGCCWDPSPIHDPYCFYSNAPSNNYYISSVKNTATGLTAILSLQNRTSNVYGADIGPLQMDVYFETNQRLHVKIYDPNNQRWEVPQMFIPRSPPNVAADSPDYRFSYTMNPFGFAVVRASTGDVLFNTSVPSSNAQFNGLTFEDQFLEFGTQLTSPNPNIYGLGDQKRPFRLDMSGDQVYTMWASDHAMPENQNLYGSYPFYVEVRPQYNGASHGVFLLNSNAMEVYAYPQALNFRTTGGIIDLYFFTGPTPLNVVSQFQQLVGLPHMPPYWALGWHQCRYGYHNLEEIQQVVANYSAANIPLDTMWTDIDYMNEYRDFTWDPVNFPQSGMNSFVQQLHSHNQHYVVIVDPGIHFEPGYPPYDSGLAQNLFVKDNTGANFIGQVWPGFTTYPDFMNPNASGWWANNVATFLQGVPLDGLWIDMNEASNFCNGECQPGALSTTMPKMSKAEFYRRQKAQLSSRVAKRRQTMGKNKSGARFDPNDPPYNINNWGGHIPLDTHAVALDATHYGGALEYNVHNLYGFGECMATRNALETIKQQRSLVISRSTFAGAGAHAGHWLGDNESTFDDMYFSIPGIMNYAMFGFPLVGSDICGFLGDTTEELCGRWSALGAFYPFARNHNDVDSIPQEPYRWQSVTQISQTYLGVRYSLLPYYYTSLQKIHTSGGMLWTPLAFNYPTDVNTLDIDQQVMVGSALLITPVLTEGATSVNGYFPAGEWFDLLSGAPLPNPSSGRNLTIQAPIEYLPLHVRGGVVLPMQQPALTTAVTRTQPFELLVTFDSASSVANGSLFWDDGVSLSMSPNTVVQFYATWLSASAGVLNSEGTFGYSNMPPLQTVTIYGRSLSAPKTVYANNVALQSSQISFSNGVLSFTNLNLSLTSTLSIKWS